MEQLAWQLLENKKDVVAAERIFAQLTNRSRLTAPNASSNNELQQLQQMCAAVIAVHAPMTVSHTAQLDARACRHLASAVCHARFPSEVIFGQPCTDEQLKQATNRILLCIHPDKGKVQSAAACVRLSERKADLAEELKRRQEAAEEEDRKKREADEMMRQFSESLVQHDVEPLAASSLSPATASPREADLAATSPVLTGQNMFSLNEAMMMMGDSSTVVSPYHLPPLPTRSPRMANHHYQHQQHQHYHHPHSGGGGGGGRGGGASSPRPTAAFIGPKGATAPPPSPPKVRAAAAARRKFNEPLTPERKLEAMMTDLRAQRDASVKLSESCSGILNTLREENDQQNAVREQLRQQQQKVGGDDDLSDVEQAVVAQRVAESMNSLISRLKDRNSNIRLTCDITSHRSAAAAPAAAAARPSSNNNNNSTSRSTRSSSSSSSTSRPSSHRAKKASAAKCRDFAVQKLGDVLQGHLESIGESVLDTDAVADAIGEVGLASSGASFGSSMTMSASATSTASPRSSSSSGKPATTATNRKASSSTTASPLSPRAPRRPSAPPVGVAGGVPSSPRRR